MKFKESVQEKILSEQSTTELLEFLEDNARKSNFVALQARKIVQKILMGRGVNFQKVA